MVTIYYKGKIHSGYPKNPIFTFLLLLILSKTSKTKTWKSITRIKTGTDPEQHVELNRSGLGFMAMEKRKSHWRNESLHKS